MKCCQLNCLPLCLREFNQAQLTNEKKTTQRKATLDALCSSFQLKVQSVVSKAAYKRRTTHDGIIYIKGKLCFSFFHLEPNCSRNILKLFFLRAALQNLFVIASGDTFSACS